MPVPKSRPRRSRASSSCHRTAAPRRGVGTDHTPSGNKRRFKESDIRALLRKAHRDPDGSYRLIASKALDGRPIGGFRFYGTRSDDPNDVIPHEHRRELRAYGTFSAWLNHVDSKSINTLDTVIEQGDRVVVRHNLLDFGSTIGSAGVYPREAFEGWEYLMGEKGRLREFPRLASTSRTGARCHCTGPVRLAHSQSITRAGIRRNGSHATPIPPSKPPDWTINSGPRAALDNVVTYIAQDSREAALEPSLLHSTHGELTRAVRDCGASFSNRVPGRCELFVFDYRLLYRVRPKK